MMDEDLLTENQELSEAIFSLECLFVRIKEVSGFKFDSELAKQGFNNREADQLVAHIAKLAK